MKIRKTEKDSPVISTSSLPDIIFILLFFFMVATTMRQTEVKVKQELPRASETERLIKKDLLSYIYIGAPLNEELGDAPRLQLGGQIASLDEVALFVENEKEKLPDPMKSQITMAIKCDKDADLGLLTDLKTELRKANALKVVYIPVDANAGRVSF